jgi:glycosyltransferase involved in cell wall biosynthesis
MRIALFTDTFAPQVNGVAQTLMRWAVHAASRGDEVALIAPRLPGRPDHDVALHIELPSFAVPFYPELRLATPLDPWSSRRLRDFGPELVHVATEFTVGRSGLAFAASARLPLTTSFHTDFAAYLAGYGFGGFERGAWHWLRWFHERAEVTFCPSRATLEQLRSQGFHDRLRIWSRGVDATAFGPQRRCAVVREKLAPGASRIVLYVGRLAPEKRLDVLLDAFALVRSRDPGAALVIVGDGPSAIDLRKRAGQRVFFTGFLSGQALAEAYAAGDVFLFPSDTETFGNVVLEAMASGLPVIAAARGGVMDSVQPGRNGLLAAAGDAGAFADAVERVLQADDFRASLASGARAWALRRSWNAVMNELFDTYDRTVTTHAARVA